MQLFKGIQSGCYWTSILEANRNFNAWNVIMNYGYASVDNKAYICNYGRCVQIIDYLIIRVIGLFKIKKGFSLCFFT
jgi:hypothetical protein